MTVGDLETLFDYGYWANGKLLEVLSELTADEFTRPVSGGHGSLRNTLVHMLSAEWGWLDRCGGAARGAALEPSAYPSVASVFDRWREVEGHLRGFLATLRHEDLDRIVTFSLGGGPAHAMPLGQLLQHAALHGVHHRGQLALRLRTLGHAPGNVDFLFYVARPEGLPPS